MQKSKTGKIIFIIITSIILIVAIAFGAMWFLGKKPLKKLDAAQIKSITMQSAPPYSEVIISSPADIQTIVAALQPITITTVADDMTDAEKRIVFTLTMADGSTRQMSVANPYFELDGVIYSTKSDPAQALVAAANSFLNTAAE